MTLTAVPRPRRWRARLDTPSDRLDEETIELMVRELGEIVGVPEKADPEGKACTRRWACG
ncbi:hypothetical protein BDW27_107142 [Nocardiopsis sp. L17-MgMaSL7]|nr:hypothetical protein BDW27_107142 [Nocardiopsis sp. L17-MgMaSL7]